VFVESQLRSLSWSVIRFWEDNVCFRFALVVHGWGLPILFDPITGELPSFFVCRQPLLDHWNPVIKLEKEIYGRFHPCVVTSISRNHFLEKFTHPLIKMNAKQLVSVVGSLKHKLKHQEKWSATFATVLLYSIFNCFPEFLNKVFWVPCMVNVCFAKSCHSSWFLASNKQFLKELCARQK